MMAGMKMDGLVYLRRKLASGSKKAYEMKKMVRVKLYLCVDIGMSWVRWAILALPMFVRSRKQMRYKKQSWQMTNISIVLYFVTGEDSRGTHPWDQMHVNLPQKLFLLYNNISTKDSKVETPGSGW